MPKCYGVDFRKKILEAYLNKEGSIPQLANRFKVSESTVKRIAKRHRETGEIKLYLHNAGRHELIDEAGKKNLESILMREPDLTLSEIQERYFSTYGIRPVIAVFHRVLKSMKLNYKKKSHFAQQQLRDDVKKKRRFHRTDQEY